MASVYLDASFVSACVTDRTDPRSIVRLQKIIRDIGDIKTVAANPIAFLKKEDYPLHRVLRAIGEITPIDQLTDDMLEEIEHRLDRLKRKAGL